MANMYELSNSAWKSFNKLWNYDDGNGGYLWQRADQMHSYLFFCNMADKARATDPAWKVDFWSPLRAQMLVGNEMTDFGNYDLFLRILTREANGLWTDDFGWTGITCVVASQFFEGDIARARWGSKAAVYADQYATLAVMAFNIMCDRYQENVGKPIINGLSNANANAPDDGAKNTVTNANFFALCMKLQNLLKNYNGTDPLKLKAKAASTRFAQLQYKWFVAWIKQRAAPPKIPYNYFHILYAGSPIALVEAQPHTDPVTAPDYTYGSTDHPLWYPGTVWSGDQGLFAYAMSSFWLSNPNLSEVPPVIAAVVQGSWNMFANSQHMSWMIGPVGAGDSIIREPPTQAVFSDAGDYVVGRGVMCRFFADAETRAALASPAINYSLEKYFGYIFKATAGAIKFDKSGNLISDLGDQIGMGKSMEHFKAAWGKDITGKDYKYSSGFWGQISTDSVVLCQELILAFDVVGAWLAVQPGFGEGEDATATENGTGDHHHHHHHHHEHHNGHHHEENGVK